MSDQACSVYVEIDGKLFATKTEYDSTVRMLRERHEKLEHLVQALERSGDEIAAECDSLRAESLALRKAVEKVKDSLIALDDILNAGDGVEIYCDVNPEDCDHCVAQHHIDEAQATLAAVGKKEGSQP